MKLRNRLLMGMLMPVLLISQSVIGQSKIFSDVKDSPAALSGIQQIFPANYDLLSFDRNQFLEQLEKAATKAIETQLLLPIGDGKQALFLLRQTEVMHPELGRRFPAIKTYTGSTQTGPQLQVHLTVSHKGIDASISGFQGQADLLISPLNTADSTFHMLYRRDELTKPVGFECGALVADPSKVEGLSAHLLPGDCQLRQFELAVSTTGEYTAYHGGTVVDGLAAVVVVVNRINQVFERDLSISFQLVPNNDLLIQTDAATDPFTNSSPATMQSENISHLASVIGAGGYDIGHVFATSFGGIAYIGEVCDFLYKGGGVSGISTPIGDFFAIDYVSHEIGHQFGARHTQNNNCNRSSASSYEPGSGSTIMSYSGICPPNVQYLSDPFFHGISLDYITAYVGGFGGLCSSILPSSNSAPTVSAGIDYTIPANTPFKLTATANDLDGDLLTYAWEQWEPWISVQPPLATSTSGPNFRALNPDSDPARYFPNLTDLASGLSPTWEVLSAVSRNMPFRVTVRDNHLSAGCTAEDEMLLSISAAAGPFTVLTPLSGTVVTSGVPTAISWDVAGTDLVPISCSTVSVMFSVDGGYSFPYVLASALPNTGSADVIFPGVLTSDARIMVIADGNVFLNLNPGNFEIQIGGGLPNCATADAPINLVSTIDASTVNLSWSPVIGALGYRVSGGPVGTGVMGSSSPLLGEFNTNFSIPLSLLSSGLIYQWSVRAACGPLPTGMPITPASLQDFFTTPF